VTGKKGESICFIYIRPGEKGRLIIEFPYDPERVAKIRTIPGRRWHPEERVWSVPADEGMIERLLALFVGEEVEVDPAVRPARQPHFATDHPGGVQAGVRPGGHS